MIPQTGDEESQRLTKPKYQERAYDLYLGAIDVEGNYAEDDNSSFFEDMAMSSPSASTKGAPSVKVGTDCSGIEIPIIALKNTGTKYREYFYCDTQRPWT